jgi:hypothetical protein
MLHAFKNSPSLFHGGKSLILHAMVIEVLLIQSKPSSYQGIDTDTTDTD